MKKISGDVVYMYAFDIAYEIKRKSIQQLLGCPVEQYSVDFNKRNPKQIHFYKSEIIRLPIESKTTPHGKFNVEYTVKLLPIGAISIQVKVPFNVQHIDELIEYHDIEFEDGPLYKKVLKIAEEVRQELAPNCTRVVEKLADEEAYTVFCIHSETISSNDMPNAEKWWNLNRRAVAALLTQEPKVENLSQQEAEESTGLFLSYYEQDLLVIDWDAALLIDDPKNFEESLYIIELANIQLAELEAYDRILDDYLERAYRELRGDGSSRSQMLREMREIRIDLTRMNDSLSNITKFFGDWHLARIYHNVASRFHLTEWYVSLGNKLKTLDGLYEILNQERSNRMMLILEITIVLLFIIDLIVLLMGLK